MPARRWRPDHEAAATSTLAVFIEWLRAVHGRAAADPDFVRRWPATDRPAFAAAIAGFAGFDPALGFRGNLLRRCGVREALVLRTERGRTAWSGHALRGSADLPEPVAATLNTGGFADLVALAASHLLVADTRPDDRLLWLGDRSDPWPLGAWIVGAAVIFSDPGDRAAIAGQERATPVSRAPAGWPC